MLRLPAALGSALVLVACGGPRLRGAEFRDGEAYYRIGPVGDRWTPLAVEDQNDLAWHDPATDAIVQVNATCDPGADVPLTALTNHLLAGFTARELRGEGLVPLDGREALRTHVVARLDGVTRELLLYVLKKDGCVYDFALVTAPGAPFERALEGFEPFVSGFRTLGGEASP